jgi:hypothetical protein
MDAGMRRRDRVVHGVLLALTLATALHGCASATKTVTVTGVSLRELGTQYLQVGGIYNDGCATGAITQPQCAKFAAFATEFKRSYPLAIGLWETARTANDMAAVGNAEAVINSLAASLSRLASEALMTYPRPTP